MKSLSSQQKSSAQELISIIGVDEKQAIDLLKKYNWNVNTALDKFYETGGVGQAVPTSNKTLDAEFAKYANAQTNQIEVQGMGQFFKDLQVEFIDPVISVICWNFGAKKSGIFTKEEFTRGMVKIGCNSLNDLKGKIKNLRNDLKNEDIFKQVYRFTFELNKTGKNLSFQAARALWDILLKDQFPFIKQWLAFLDQTPEAKKKDISQDLWLMLLEFHYATRGDLSKYDPNGAWPTMIDDFMEYMEKNK